MQTDRYTKFILTVIAFGLVANLLGSFLKPTPAIAQSSGKKWSELRAFATNDERDWKAAMERVRAGWEPFAVDSNQIWLRK